MKWPAMPPSRGQSPVLFEDGYAEGWAKCLSLCQAAVGVAPIEAEPEPVAWRYRYHQDGPWHLAEKSADAIGLLDPRDPPSPGFEQEPLYSVAPQIEHGAAQAIAAEPTREHWRQIAELRWQMIEQLTRERDAAMAAALPHGAPEPAPEPTAISPMPAEPEVLPVQLESYLTAKGWQKDAELPNGNGSIWHRQDNADAEVVVPADHVRDQRRAIADALAAIAQFEGRSPAAVAKDVDDEPPW